jgi:hypothetical protein
MQSRIHVERVRIIPYDVQATVTRQAGCQGEERTLWIRTDCMTGDDADRMGADLASCEWSEVPGIIRTYLDS